MALACVFSAPSFCGEWTEHEKSLFDESLQIRLESRKVDGLKAALDWLGKKREEFFSSIENESVGQEAILPLSVIIFCGKSTTSQRKQTTAF